MARGDGRLFPRGGVWWAAFCIDGVEKVARVSARATKPKPSSLCLAWPERIFQLVRRTSSVLYSSADPQLRWAKSSTDTASSR
jgi:hypothetical protein